ncbi:RNA-directed DNA polymerase, eukaryota, partial [Tanacetum coccineum]
CNSPHEAGIAIIAVQPYDGESVPGLVAVLEGAAGSPPHDGEDILIEQFMNKTRILYGFSFKVKPSSSGVRNIIEDPVLKTPGSCSPALVLDDTCVNAMDLSRHVMGRTKEVNSIPNLRSILTNEGFSDVQLSYLGGLCPASHDFVCNERIVWVDIEGVPLHIWSSATFSGIGKKWGTVMDIEESPGSSFARKRLCIKTSMADNILETFKVIFKGKVFSVRAKELFTWSPCFLEYKDPGYISEDESILVSPQAPCDNVHDVNEKANSKHSDDPFGFYDLLRKPINTTDNVEDPCLSHPPDHHEVNQGDPSTGKGSSSKLYPKASYFSQDPHGNDSSANFSTHVHSRSNPKGGSILDVLDGMIKILSLNVQGLGHKTKKEWVKELNFKHGVNFLALQETKMESISHMDVKSIWGNSNYQFVVSGSIGNSGGILCVWEESIFKKVDVSISDNFIALYGIWLPTNSRILIVVIYAPQSFALKRILWDYISGLINHWNGETIVLGDFNEVRCEEERFGSLFYQSCAREFNHFISSSGLLEVKMEGYSFTWSHPTATKMSKLDRFLVSEGIFVTFPIISAVCLDRHLSDQDPYLRNEISFLIRSPHLFGFIIPGSNGKASMSWWNTRGVPLLTMIPTG